MPTSKPIRRQSSVYHRPATPVAGRFTPRDGRILEAIHAYDGVLADAQLKALFFTGESQFKLRLRYLFQHGYVARPSYKRRASLSRMVYWLDTKGAACVAGLTGTPLTELVYVKEPRWSQLDHDMAVNDVRIAVTLACQDHAAFTIADWIPQSEFYRHPDKVEYVDGHGAKKARYVRPDAYLILTDHDKPYRFLLELDMATETNVRFAREKVLPGLAYLRSTTYATRFGHASGRFLVVTTSERKLTNLKRQTELVAGKDAKLFLFTTISQLRRETVLTAPIWQQGGDRLPRPLFEAEPPQSL